MRRKKLSALLVALLLPMILVVSVSAQSTQKYRQAVRLYNSGMYEQALSLFESETVNTSDPMIDGYIVMCALKMRTPGYADRVKEYDSKYSNSLLYPQIHFLYGMNLFDDAKYEEAYTEFNKVPQKLLSRKEKAELLFKEAYCDFAMGRYDLAKQYFERVVQMPYSDYSSPSRYALGYISYNDKDFEEAYKWFSGAVKDARFAQTASYYMLECRFMLNDYRYVVENGEEIYKTIPEERKPHLARILSESFLIIGNAGKAKEYYDKNILSKPVMNRADYFYAGSLQFTLGNYQEAIDNYNMMTMRTDSIGQIANYQLGYSYVQTKNKVKAFEAFGQAAGAGFDIAIQEDAYFNYAKLAFDLNNDVTAFRDYLDKFKNSGRGDQIYDYIAVASLLNHDYAAAVEAYDNIDDLTDEMRGNYMKANYLRANQLIKSGSYRDAIPCLRAATFFTPRQDNFNKMARYWLAESYYRIENYPEAIKIFTDLYNISALEMQEEGKLISYNLAYCYFNTGDYVSSAKWLDSYIQSRHATNREDALIRRADCDFLRKDYKAAANSYAAVINEYPMDDDVYAYYRQGVSYGLSGNNSSKIAALMPVLNASPEASFYSDAIYELGRAYVQAGKTQDAMNSFNQLMQTTKDSSYMARTLIEMGMIYRNNSDYDKALEYYCQVVEDMPGMSYRDDALLAVESIYQSKGEPDKYLEYLNSLSSPISKTELEKEMLYFSSAEQIYITNDYQRALLALDKYVQAYPQGSKLYDAYFYTAECYKNLDQKEKAAEYYAQVANSDIEGSFKELSMLNFANISYSLERYDDAFGAYSSLRSSAQIDNNVFTAQLGMMRSAYRARSYTGAIKCAETVKEDPRSSDAHKREADYIKAKSLLATSQRDMAFDILKELSKLPATDEGAEATYLIIQDVCDRGEFEDVEALVYKFAEDAPNQSYWMAKAFIVLGDSFAERDNMDQAKATFESVLSGYEPANGVSDDVTEAVKMRLNKIQEL